jgi:sulfate adenylyltransferase
MFAQPGDVDHYTRVRCYKAILEHYPRGMAVLALNPLAMRMGGPREALLHAIERKVRLSAAFLSVSKYIYFVSSFYFSPLPLCLDSFLLTSHLQNFGCNYFIIGRDHAGPGKDSNGKDFYGPYDAQALAKKYEHELGIKLLFYNMVVYVEEMGDYLQDSEVPKVPPDFFKCNFLNFFSNPSFSWLPLIFHQGMRVLNISGTELRRRLFRGLEVCMQPFFFLSLYVRL